MTTPISPSGTVPDGSEPNTARTQRSQPQRDPTAVLADAATRLGAQRSRPPASVVQSWPPGPPASAPVAPPTVPGTPAKGRPTSCGDSGAQAPRGFATLSQPPRSRPTRTTSSLGSSTSVATTGAPRTAPAASTCGPTPIASHRCAIRTAASARPASAAPSTPSRSPLAHRASGPRSSPGPTAPRSTQITLPASGLSTTPRLPPGTGAGHSNPATSHVSRPLHRQHPGADSPRLAHRGRPARRSARLGH